MDATALWNRYQRYLCRCPEVGLGLDISRMRFGEDYLPAMEEAIQRAYDAMEQLEAGAIANPDEQRMVGHYWLRSPELAPSDTIRQQIEQTVQDVIEFSRDVHTRQIVPSGAARFTDVLHIGIGGSALGPQLVADALSSRQDKLAMHFLDNTDPDGFRRTLDQIGTRLKSTLVLVVSKSGSTPETRNGMLEIKAALKAKGLNFARQAVAITGVGSHLDQQAQQEQWLRRFPMWDWVGGRTSLTSAVGLLPAALQGVDIQALLDGAARMDQCTRQRQTLRNPAALMALMWHWATGGRGGKDLVILPYKDRLLLLSRYLQQLIMESLGKEKDLDGQVVHQGLTVYGNKGSTDQHAYIQQLRDGLNNFFATFIVVLQDTARPGAAHPLEVDEHVTSGDYLHGFWQGTRQALHENGRDSMTLTLEKLDARSLGGLIALFERAVGFYATLVHINAYHQPGVEAGKKAAAGVLELQKQLVRHLQQHPEEEMSLEQLAQALSRPDQIETIHHVLEHLAANKRYVARRKDLYRFLPTRMR